MPAVTADTLTLPRVGPPGADATERPVRSITSGPRAFEGEGFPVVRAFAGVGTAALDPFVHMDQIGAVEYQPGEPRGTDWHPHRGFETVTYMIDGKLAHQDSYGGGGLITDGATQWMTAGSGILHIETPPIDTVRRGGTFHGVQLWVNLPKKDKFTPPRYQAIEGGDVTLIASDDGGALVRIISGEIDGHGGPGSTHSPITLAHATIQSGSRLNIPWRRDFNSLVYVLSGAGSVGTAGHPIRQGQLAVLGSGDRISVTAGPAPDAPRTTALDVLLLGGRPIREPVFHYGPFVMNTRAEVIEALEDYQAGKFRSIPPNALKPNRGGGTL
ncbi:pirin [Mycobacterium kansasii]|uniref:Quercetin 2,3-dioxygenase n=1 Tax=Mycobacterium attenuatum TaxID=2341086 RepID=A0A498PMI4_9MYCO|nr:pirin family protein [Mycobacterium attenuatum]ORB84984.1 pirin [Mycobacterium kansasii]VBA32178.1 Putative quercetin 2,3-dioxygenase [Mycobacterium attenuatum]VBA44986.1 Putative quercetin 2,3-dioxygenase [Mycobacterium attenuatum]VBA45973.1 Putative quercetin 2,3-dioxygenase [Mycobacterium attenuatum]